jgi:polyhydroxyalkanoate synthesis regulator phasin
MCDEKKKKSESCHGPEEREDKGSKEMKVSELVQKFISASWGFISFSEEKAKSFIDEMIRRGEISRKEGESLLKHIRDKVQTGARETEQKVTEVIQKYMKTRPAAENEMEILRVRIVELEKRLADLEKKEQSKEPTGQS